MTDTRDPFLNDLAEAVGGLTYLEIDQFVDAMFERSDTLPYTFNRAIHCNLKKREDIKNGLINESMLSVRGGD